MGKGRWTTIPGELRWYAMVDGHEVERPNGEAFNHKGETIRPRSRTFIPARLMDNPHLLATGYGATLQAMPEPLLPRKLSPVDIFVDIGQHGHGPSVARLRNHGVTPEELERLI